MTREHFAVSRASSLNKYTLHMNEQQDIRPNQYPGLSSIADDTSDGQEQGPVRGPALSADLHAADAEAQGICGGVPDEGAPRATVFSMHSMRDAVGDTELQVGATAARPAVPAAPPGHTAAAAAAAIEDDDEYVDPGAPPVSDFGTNPPFLREVAHVVRAAKDDVLERNRAQFEGLQAQINELKQAHANASYQSPGYGAPLSGRSSAPDSGSTMACGGEYDARSDGDTLAGSPAVALRKKGTG